MKHLTFYFDVISPYAYLAFEQLPKALAGLSYSVAYKPVLFAAMLKQHGQLGPAEITPKREWTYRQVAWLARESGVELQLPASHPFNPLPLLRLALACGRPAPHGQPNRWVCERVFRHVWQGGLEPADAQRLQALAATLQHPDAPLAAETSEHAASVKQQLQSNTDEAIALGVFGVPSVVIDGQIFWGLDALPMLRQYLSGDDWFAGHSWKNACQIAVGAHRNKR